jgi:transposase
VIPADFAGIMVCDRGQSYDAEELEGVAQQKCLAHLIRNAAGLVEEKAGGARQLDLRLKHIPQRALLLSGSNHQMAEEIIPG